MTRYSSSLCWFRRDLRTADHAALYAALKATDRVFCAFVFDTGMLDKLPGRSDRRVEFIRRYVPELAGCDDEAVHAPWLMDEPAQKEAGVRIGRDYPAPVVAHDTQRKLALAL